MSSPHRKPMTAAEYERMAKELEAMAEKVMLESGGNHQVAERLQRLAKQIREDNTRKPKPPKA
jgi:hypothetical protein